MTNTKNNVRSIVLCALFAALSAVGAFIKIPLPVIPMTLQFFFVALSGILLGPRRGLLSQLCYLLVGLAGFPVFTKGGGVSYVFEMSFGYLIGFVFAAFVIGTVYRKLESRGFVGMLVACLCGMLTNHFFGCLHMYLLSNFYLHSAMSFWRVIQIGSITFLPSDSVACLLTALIASKVVPLLKRAGLV
ncbi:biotin transporter BioY [Feifania hominis]|uniref:Biotin transporter n=1 Tax=Feifania hominis TaxID=2763660 RepID=A0A926HUT9_9FIRM|nr:biotin transporter BioY [Feifania hominis]MBC8535911.1 biotin transporter BioY [Feifania hominis]